MLNHFARHALHLRGALPDLPSPPSQLLAEPGAQGGLIEKSGRLGVPKQRTAIQRRPPAIRTLRHVRRHFMGMQKGIASPRRVMLKRRYQRAAARLAHRPRTSAAHNARLALEYPSASSTAPSWYPFRGSRRLSNALLGRGREQRGDWPPVVGGVSGLDQVGEHRALL